MNISRILRPIGQALVALGLMGSPLAVTAVVWAAPTPSAETGLAQASLPPQPFSDLPPDHWAYQAVQSLVQNYGCLAGYPDGTFRGDQPVSRYEFAAGLNACLDAVSGEIEARRAANQAEIDRLIQSMQEFQAELDSLENEVGP